MPSHFKFRSTPAQMGKFHRRLLQLEPQAAKAAMLATERLGIASLRARTVSADKLDTRALVRGWWSRRTRDGFVLGNRALHHPNVERGRLPGRMPPVSVIEAWAARKLGRRGLGWPIARAIAKRGIRPTPILTSVAFRERLREISRRETERRWLAASRRAAATKLSAGGR